MERREYTLENMVINSLFKSIYKNKTVLVTGHTGFKGSWLCYWLNKLGAKVIGYSINIPTKPNHFNLLNLNIVSEIGDIRNKEKLNNVIKKYSPDIIFHLAAQALVKNSYNNPVYTYETNINGTLNILEACRLHNIQALINITTDKVYENINDINHSYKENDRLGGYDPYSSSKACSEILTNSYRNSFFNINEYKKSHETLVATCRAGNVIGGGDWGEARLITDIMININKNKSVHIRNPHATRPWQHVLEPLSGYLNIGQKLLEKEIKFSDAWNFGPVQSSKTVKEVLEMVKTNWDKLEYTVENKRNKFHEAKYLRLNSNKAYNVLQWQNTWDFEDTIKYTVHWYKEFYDNNEILTEKHLKQYINDSITKGLSWTKS